MSKHIYPLHIKHGETLEHFLSQFKNWEKSRNFVIEWDCILRDQFQSAQLRENSAGEKFITLAVQGEMDV